MLRHIVSGARTSFTGVARALTISADLFATRCFALGGRPIQPKPRNPFSQANPTLTRSFFGSAPDMGVTIGNLGAREMSLVGTLILDFALNWGAWAIAVAFKTEKFYDAVGSLSFMTVVISSLINGGHYSARQIGTTGMVLLWTARLGSFLLFRTLKTGGDSRFDEAKEKPATFFVYWTLQAVWVWVCSLPIIILNSKAANPGVGPTDIIGIVLYVSGMLIETTADFQKYFFKSDPENRGKFIDVGLWKYARYPNYFGEMLVWWGIFLTTAKGLKGWEFLSVASPCLVMLLLLGASGVPIQERQAKERWGDDPAYHEYRRRTNLLAPIPKCWIAS